MRFSHQSGIYEDQLELSIDGNFDKLYYTTDGSNPNNGRRYNQPIKISENTVVRVVPYHNGSRLDTLFMRSFIFNFKTSLPVVSIALEDSALWSDSYGIYVKGNNAYYNDSTRHWENCNFQQKWEREMHVELIDTAGATMFNQPAGLRIFGETTRRYPEKSMKIVARSEYGPNRFQAQVFSTKPQITEHKQFVLRTSGNDYRGSRFKDCLNSYLIRNLGLDYMAFQPVQLFVNGQYWGLYNLREKVNKHYLYYNHGAHHDSSSIIMGRWVRQHGSARDYMRMYRFFENLDTMDNRAYRKAGEMLDLRNYINFRIVQIFLNNSDSRGNIRYWNSKDLDGKFRMILYDTDHSHGTYHRNYLEHCLSETPTHWYNPKWSTMYLTRLMQHPEFKEEFTSQFAHLLNTTLHPDTIKAAANYFEAWYENELPRDPKLLPRQFAGSALPDSVWRENVARIRSFSDLRNDHLWKELERLLAPKGTYILKLEGELGKVAINNNVPVKLPYSGKYFRGFDLVVRPVEDSLYAFEGWEDGSKDSIRVVRGESDTVVIRMQFRAKPQKTEQVVKIDTSSSQSVLNEANQSEWNRVQPEWLNWLAWALIAIGAGLIMVYVLRKPRT